MEILWPALGICIIVMFVFFVLSQHWQKLLRRQAWTIRKLTERVRDLEEMGDPEFRKRLSESSPVPLEQVFNFSFRFSDHFWSETLGLSGADWDYVRAHGSFAGSIKLERWRSHTVATVTEVLPESKTVQWQTRTLDFYPDPANGAGFLKLWDLSLTKPDGTALKPPSLELTLSGNSVRLSGHAIANGRAHGSTVFVMGHGNGNGNGNGDAADFGEMLIFRAPLDSAQLAQFRSLDPVPEDTHGSESEQRVHADGSGWNSWQAFYSNQNEAEGWEWHLWLRDLGKKAEWERWKILESPAIPVGAARKA
jgi:hypothetical protein